MGGGPGLQYATHFASLNGKRVRNYSICYDTHARISLWVAYPLHPVYTEGSSGGSGRWTYDPLVKPEYQADLSAGSYAGNTSEAKYERGHQIPNADRKANTELNAQTYYATNSTPQMSLLNGRAWAKLEAWVRSRAAKDTLYVVTGAVLLKKGEAGEVAYDRDKGDPSVPVGIPRYYYKVLLQRSSSDPSGYRSIGFWYEHKASDDPVKAEYTLSVREVEQMTGLDFFTNLPEATQNAIETANRPEEWGLR